MKNLRQLALAMQKYCQANRTLPPAARYAQDQPLLSWRVLLLPYLGREALYKEFHLDEPWDSPHNRALIARMPEVYRTPGGPEEEKTCYVVPVGARSIFSQREGMALAAVRDGLKNTLLILEVDPDRAVVWTQPEDLRIIPAQPGRGLGGLRGDHFLAVCADGMPHRLSTTLDAATLRALISAAGGERVAAEVLSGAKGEGTAGVKPTLGLFEQGRFYLALRRGKQGIAYLMAAAIATPDEKVLGKVRWSPGLNRPVLAVRWGLAVHTATRSAPPPNQPNQPQQPGGELGGGSAQAWSSPLGKLIVQRLRDRLDEGAFGSWLLKPKKEEVEQAMAAGIGLPEGKAAERPAGQVEGMGPEAMPAMPGMMPAMPAAPGGPEAGLAPGQGEVGGEAVFDGVGLVDLGSADPLRARQMALAEGLDVLLLAEVSIKPGRGRAPSQTVLVLHIVDVLGNKTLWSSRPLSDVRVQSAQQGKDRQKSDPMAELVKSLTNVIDERLALSDLPEMDAQDARARAEALTLRQTENPLPALLELRCYQWKKWLTPDELARFFGKLIGPEDGLRLVQGTADERQEILQQWLPKR